MRPPARFVGSRASHSRGRPPLSRLFALLVSLLLVASACARDNELYCANSADCAARAADDPTVGLVCHPIGHFCYDGEAGDGGVGDGGGRANGDKCDDPRQCKSQVCSAGICCDTPCAGECRSCATGKCTPLAKDTPCKSDSCLDAAKLERWRCDGAGVCKDDSQHCGGFRCESGACLTKCTDAGQCVSGLGCDTSKGTCVGDLPAGAACGENDAICASKKCTDGVCCQVDDCGTCQRCQSGSGACGPVPAGPAPPGQCAGDSSCGAGQCDGAGGCAYNAAGSACGPSTCAGSPSRVEQKTCDASGGCTQTKTTVCGFSRCTGAAGSARCVDGCAAAGADCVANSACDRADAHKHPSGRGTCLDPATVVVLGASETLAQGVAKIAGARTALRVPAGSYSANLSFVNTDARIIADGAVVVTAASASLPVVTVSGTSKVQLQGVTLRGGSKGVSCVDGAVTVLDSRVEQASDLGVDARKCTVTLRRSRFEGNSGGGADIAEGGWTVVNNVFHGNGRLNSSAVGGARLTRTSGSATLRNNTFTSNVAAVGVGAGAQCSGTVTLVSAIVWGNATMQTQGCSFDYSTVQGGVAGGSGNGAADPMLENLAGGDVRLKSGSPAANAGDPTASTSNLSTIDRDGRPRVNGGRIDQGAFER